MTLQFLLPAIFSLLGVAIGVGSQYLSGRALETRKQLAQQRSQSYVDYFRAVALIARTNSSRENLSLAADAKTRICIYGSPAVIAQLSAFEAAGSNTATPEGQETVIKLLNTMRIDVGKGNQEITEPTLQMILFGRPRG